jgi:hypothetical protein
MYYLYGNDGEYLSSVSSLEYLAAGVGSTEIEPPECPSDSSLRFIDGVWTLNAVTRLPFTYRDKRRENYPTVEYQLDALWHAMDEGVIPMVDSFYVPIANVKDRFPKDVPVVTEIVPGSV